MSISLFAIQEPGIYVDSEGDLLFVDYYDKTSELKAAWITVGRTKRNQLLFFPTNPPGSSGLNVTLQFKLGPLGKYLYL